MPEQSSEREPRGPMDSAGRAGANPHPGGEKKEEIEDVMPYDEVRQKSRGDSESSEALTGTIQRQLAETDPGKGAGDSYSPATESPVSEEEVAHGAAGAGDQSPTDATATSPHGVGPSETRSGEDIVKEEGEGPDRQTVGTKGESERPVGKSTPRDSTGIEPEAHEPVGDAETLPGGYGAGA